MKKSFRAERDQLGDVLAFIDAALEAADCPVKAQTTVDVCVEEMFVNIADYAYPDSSGEASVTVDIVPESGRQLCIVTLEDGGMPFNPLERPEPDTSLEAEQRGIGGLGIFMTRKMMDGVEYEYSCGLNRLTLKKYLN